MAGHLARGLRAMLAADFGRVLSKGLLILVFTRYLFTPDEYGLFFLVLAILGTVNLLSSFGLPKSTARYVTEFIETDEGQVPLLIRFSFAILAVSTVIVCAALVLLSGRIETLLGEDGLAPLLVVGVGYIVGLSIQTHASLLFQSFNDVRWSALVKTISSVGQLILGATLVLLGYGVYGALWGFVMAALLAAAVAVFVLYSRFYSRYEADGAMESGVARRVLRYSVPLTATKGANLLDKRVDTILIGYFMNTTAVGYYTLAKQISEFVMTPAASLGFTVAPQYGTYKAKENLDRAADLYQQAFLSTVTLYVPAAAGMVLVAGPAVRYVFGDAYLGAVPAVQVFGFYTLLLALGEITNDGLDYLGRANARATAKGITSVMNFGLNLFLIPLYGVVGAAVATIVTFSILVAVELIIIVRELPLSPWTLTIHVGRATLIAGVMSVAVVALLPYVTGLFTLVAAVSTGVAIWAVLATASGAVDVTKVRAVLG